MQLKNDIELNLKLSEEWDLAMKLNVWRPWSATTVSRNQKIIVDEQYHLNIGSVNRALDDLLQSSR